MLDDLEAFNKKKIRFDEFEQFVVKNTDLFQDYQLQIIFNKISSDLSTLT